uniref:USP domain-containing protein n=1 Tax=Macrostomum lignano TaxID=282301 RepID=A0A1I8FBZ4_9PLAT
AIPCYANAVLQVLCYTPGLYNHLRKLCYSLHRIDRLVTESMQEKLALPLSCAFVEHMFIGCFAMIRVERRTCRPGPRLLRILRSMHCAFTPGEEHDAQELLLCALDAVQPFRNSLAELARGLGEQPAAGCCRCLSDSPPPPAWRRPCGCQTSQTMTVRLKPRRAREAAAAGSDSYDAPLLRLDEFVDDDDLFSITAAATAAQDDGDSPFPVRHCRAHLPPPRRVSTAGATGPASTPSRCRPACRRAAPLPRRTGRATAGRGSAARPDAPTPLEVVLAQPGPAAQQLRPAFGADAFKLRAARRANRLIAAESPRRPLGQQNLAVNSGGLPSATLSPHQSHLPASAAAAQLPHPLPWPPSPPRLPASAAHALRCRRGHQRRAGPTNDENFGASPLKTAAPPAVFSVLLFWRRLVRDELGGVGRLRPTAAALLASPWLSWSLLHRGAGHRRSSASRLCGQSNDCSSYTTRCMECESETVKCQPFSIISCPVKPHRRSPAADEPPAHRLPPAPTRLNRRFAAKPVPWNLNKPVPVNLTRTKSRDRTRSQSLETSPEPVPVNLTRTSPVNLTRTSPVNLTRTSPQSDAGLRAAVSPLAFCERRSADTGDDKFLLRPVQRALAGSTLSRPDAGAGYSEALYKVVSSQAPCRSARRRYELYAVIIHDGLTISSGHYTSLVRLPEPGSGWFSFDDDL